MTYDVEVTRDGRWWMIAIPALDGLTQTRRLAEAAAEAIDYIAVTTDVPKSSVSVELHVRVDDLDATAEAESTRALKTRAEELELAASTRTRGLVRQLADKHVPYRDIGTIVGISAQRAHKLADASPRP